MTLVSLKSNTSNLKTLSIDTKITEQLLATPVDLPTLEPASPQITFTLADTMLPTFSFAPFSYSLYPFILLGGKNTTASTQGISYRVYKNGVEINTGSLGSATANQLWTCQFYRVGTPVFVGDVLTIKLWASVAGVNYDYTSITLNPSRIHPEKTGTLYRDVMISVNRPTGGVPLLGNPSNYGNYASYTYIEESTSYGLSIASGNSINPGAFKPSIVYGFNRCQGGDLQTGTYVLSHATYRPYYYFQAIPVFNRYRTIG